MPVKPMPFEIKANVYLRLLTSADGRKVAKEIGVTYPSICRYAADVIHHLREITSRKEYPELASFLFKPLRLQIAGATVKTHTDINKLLKGKIATNEQAADFRKRTGGDNLVCTRLNDALFRDFNQVGEVCAKEIGRDFTNAELLRFMIERFVKEPSLLTGKEPSPELQSPPSQSIEIMSDIMDVLAKHGVKK